MIDQPDQDRPAQRNRLNRVSMRHLCTRTAGPRSLSGVHRATIATSLRESNCFGPSQWLLEDEQRAPLVDPNVVADEQGNDCHARGTIAS
jgi:hypothetical protein